MFYPALTENIGCVAAAVSSLACLGFRSVLSKSRKVRTTVADKASRRFFPRPPNRFDAVIDPGNGTGALRVRGVNFHRCGALVYAQKPLVPNSIVHFHIPSMCLMGYAHVRHCDEASGKYRIGLEFRTELLRSVPGTWNVKRVQEKESWIEE